MLSFPLFDSAAFQAPTANFPADEAPVLNRTSALFVSVDSSRLCANMGICTSKNAEAVERDLLTGPGQPPIATRPLTQNKGTVETPEAPPPLRESEVSPVEPPDNRHEASIPTHVAIASQEEEEGGSYVSDYADPPRSSSVPSSPSSSQVEELLGVEQEENVAASVSRQENLSVCFLAASQLLNLANFGCLALDDLHRIIGAGMDQVGPPSQNFNALVELSNRLRNSSDLLELSSYGRDNRYFAFDHERLVTCMFECVNVARENNKRKLALFCVTPSNQVFLAMYHSDSWWAWNTEPAMLEQEMPDMVATHWLAAVPNGEGITLKAVVFHPQFEARPAIQDEIEHMGSPASKKEEEKVEITDEIDTSSGEPPSYGPIQPVAPTVNLPRPRSHSTGSSSGPSGPPPQYLCPIMHYLMADPVAAKDGETYDRRNIEKHFKTHNTSPITRAEISTSLYENRALRQLIEDYVRENESTMDEEDLDDFRTRQQARIDGTSPDPIIPPDDEPDDEPAQVPLCRLVRLSRPTEEDRLGNADSGLSVALGDEAARQSADSNTVCSVGCCTKTIGPVAQWCKRCQRATCRACLVSTVSNICLPGSVYKQTKICLECIWQITDVIVSMDNDEESQDAPERMQELRNSRERILREHVAPRLAAMNEEMFELLYNSLLQKADDEKSISELLEIHEKLQEQLRKVLGEASPSTETGIASETGNAAATRDDHALALDSIGRYDHALPLELTFPTIGMERHIAALRQWRSERESELYSAARRQRVREIQGSSQNTGTPQRSNSLIDLLVDLPDAFSLAETLIAQVDVAEGQHSSRRMRMCAYCASGPFDTLPFGGCPSCNWQERDFEQWPLWDGRFPGGDM